MPPVRRSQIEAHEIHRGKGLDAHMSMALTLSTIQVTVRFSSVKFPKWTIDGGTTDLHLHNLGIELKGREYSPVPCIRDFSPQNLRTPRFNEHVLRVYLVALGIESRPSGLQSDALTTRIPTALI
ncbi:hypothetical protein TNCV_4828081 [Trichonephila clavipes]|uniref:Uncharacterized protein n=1 Tax=Trichonephila clavipes TaxID=2585209 RepID=A0A8X6SN36_TRICX|nr:hypothetical protein TNCV_4828081 [Trichonephila clavipes]